MNSNLKERIHKLWETNQLRQMGKSNHVSPLAFQDIREGFTDEWSLNAFSEHINNCEICQFEKQDSLKNQFNIFRRMDEYEIEFAEVDEDKVLSRKLARAIREHQEINIVSGEAPANIWNERVKKAFLELLIERKGNAKVILGPVLSTDENGYHIIEDLVKVPGFNLYYSGHRQAIHFRISDRYKVFYVEKHHEPHQFEREATFGRQNPEINAYFALRFQYLLRSHDVIPVKEKMSLWAISFKEFSKLTELVENKGFDYDKHVDSDFLDDIYRDSSSSHVESLHRKELECYKT